MKVNSQSITIKTEKSLHSTWLEILTANLGNPVEKGSTHGKKFTIKDQCEGGYNSCVHNPIPYRKSFNPGGRKHAKHELAFHEHSPSGFVYAGLQSCTTKTGNN